MTASSLNAIGVSVEFDSLRALDNVSLAISIGEIVGLIGPNGSGKTTLVNVFTGQVQPVAGRVTCDGEDITGLAPRKIALRGVARSFQIVRLFNNLTVAENVETAALTHGLSRRKAGQRARELLGEFGLQDFADELTSTLNYGDKRRVEVARALAGEPRYLLLDEPAAGMNEVESETLLKILANLPSDRGLGLLIIDHDMSLIMRLCNRLHVLASGATIGEGDVETVRNLPTVIEAYLGSDAGTGADRATG
ncbi:MAG: ABC transporter ATP-binding protein [Kiloniellaceae bacterium]